MVNFKEYFSIMKHSGLSWLGHLLPFGIVVAYQLMFGHDNATFNKEPVHYIRFGNSGLFLVFSQKTHNILQECRRKDDQYRREAKELKELKQFDELKKKYGV